MSCCTAGVVVCTDPLPGVSVPFSFGLFVRRDSVPERIFPRAQTALSDREIRTRRGGMSCSPTPCIKYLLLIFNCIFWLAGTGVLAVGLWLRFDFRTKNLVESEDSPHGFYTVVCILIVIGGLMMLVGFLGCCGAIQESLCMLGLFFFFLLLIFIVEVAIGIWGFSIQSKVVDDVTQFYKETYNKYKEDKQEALKETLHLIQYGLNCCGPFNSEDIDTLEETCPKREGLDVLITKSCPDAIEKFFTSKLHIIGGVGIGIGVIMILGLIFSMMLLCAIRKSQEIV